MKKFLSLSKSADSRDRFKFTLYSNIEFSKIEYHIFNKSKLNRLLVHCVFNSGELGYFSLCRIETIPYLFLAMENTLTSIVLRYIIVVLDI